MQHESVVQQQNQGEQESLSNHSQGRLSDELIHSGSEEAPEISSGEVEEELES